MAEAGGHWVKKAGGAGPGGTVFVPPGKTVQQAAANQSAAKSWDEITAGVRADEKGRAEAEAAKKNAADDLTAKIAAATGPVAIKTDYNDWTSNTRLGQDQSPSDINYRMGKPLKWNAAKKTWEGDAAGARKLARRIRSEADGLMEWAGRRGSVNASERRAHAKRMYRVATQIETALGGTGT